MSTRQGARIDLSKTFFLCIKVPDQRSGWGYAIPDRGDEEESPNSAKPFQAKC